MSDGSLDRRDPTHQVPRPGGRRAMDRPGNAWSPTRLAFEIGMSSDFVISEIKAGELRASIFGREYRIAIGEVRRYLVEKGFPLPPSLTQPAA